MQIESKCPGCGRTLRVPAEHAGKPARCPVCNAIYDVPAAPAAAEEPADAANRWSLRIPEGQTFGPVPRAVLDRWVAEGRVGDDCRVMVESDGVWRDAAAVYPELAPPAIAQTADDPAAAVPGTPAPLTSAGHARIVNPHRGGLILTLGILSWALGCAVFGVMAWVMGSNDLRDMRIGSMDAQGRGLTQAGQIIGMIHVIASLVVLVGLLTALISLGILS